MHIILTVSTGDVNFKGYIQTRWVMYIMRKICKYATMNPPVYIYLKSFSKIIWSPIEIMESRY